MKYYCLKEFDGMKNLEVYMSYKRSIIIADENLNLDLIKINMKKYKNQKANKKKKKNVQ